MAPNAPDGKGKCTKCKWHGISISSIKQSNTLRIGLQIGRQRRGDSRTVCSKDVVGEEQLDDDNNQLPCV